jgi:hypothetical protein
MLRGQRRQSSPICLYTAVVHASAGGDRCRPPRAGVRDAVRSQDIARHLKASFEGIAARYGVTQRASAGCRSFLPPDDVYARLPVAFTPPALPEPKAALAQAAREREAELAPELASRAAEAMLEQLATTLEAGVRTRGRLFQDKGGLRMAGKAVGWAIDRGIDQALDMAHWGRRKRRRARIEAMRNSTPRSPTPAALALAALVDRSTPQSEQMAPGLTTHRAAGTATPRLVRRGETVGAIGLPGGRVVPLCSRPGWHTNAYLACRSQGGGVLALDWRPPGCTDAESREALAFLVALADDRLASGEAVETLAGLTPVELVVSHPMAAVVRAYLADAAGDRGTVLALADAFRSRWNTVPFDLALLAGIADAALVTGRFPLLPAGWRLLPFARLPVHPALADLAAGLVPAYPFATLQGTAAERFLALIQSGEI